MEQAPPPPPPPSQLTASPSPTSRQRSSDGRTPSSLRLTRRQSTQERIDEILETARERAAQSPRGTASPRMEPLLQGQPAQGAPAEHESSADETTGIVMRGPAQTPHLNYQSTAQSSSSGGPRARKSALGRKSSAAVDGSATPDGEARGPAEPARESRWKKFFAKFQSIELENKGSVARDHLALERTFLAWLRTSLAFASIGVAITQLFRLNTTISDDSGSSDDNNQHLQTLRHLGKPLGATFLAISILMLFLGYNRYITSQQWILKGKFPASRGTIMLVSFLAFALMIASLVVVVVVQPAVTGS